VSTNQRLIPGIKPILTQHFHSFHVAEVASYGWHSIHDLPSSPFGHDYRSLITLNIHPKYQWVDSREPRIPLDIDLDITIVIGWHEAHHTEPLFSKERCAQAACGVLRQLDDFGVLNNDIQFSPYLENGGHRFCFPTQKPQDIIEADHPHSPIAFQSPCNCGMGDLTGSRFDCTRDYTARSTLTRALFGQYGRQSKLVSELGCKTDQVVCSSGSLNFGLSQDTPFRQYYSCSQEFQAYIHM
jgi:hypothetical protein